jgi:hypothetical protein
MYFDHRKKYVANGFIVSGSFNIIATHLMHWLTFIGKDIKLTELERTDCEDYFAIITRTKKKDTIRISQTTVENEQSSVNAMMAWLHNHKETHSNGGDIEGNLHFIVAGNGGENYFVIVYKSGDAKVMACTIIDKLAGGLGKVGLCFAKY